jgi:biotin synthase
METLSKQNLLEKIRKTYQLPLPELIFQAQTIHRENNNANEVQFCTLSSIKTGACPEDCKYCSQSARNNTGLTYEPLSDEAKVMEEARAAKANGSTRFCMGAAWREAPNNEQFDQVINMVKEVKAMDMEPCVTLGMLTKEQAIKLKEAGLHSYNHNLDTSESFYSEIITTRTFQDRLDTIKNVQDAGVEVCSGGILGMGEKIEDRLSMLETLANMDPQPASVPINVLVPIAGTPLEDADPIEDIELIRLIATTRIMIPKARIRLSAGRHSMSETLQAFCFISGANSIHTGEKLLTTPLQGKDKDRLMMDKLGMSIMS